MGTARPANTVTTCLASAETRRALPSLLSCCWRCLSMPLPKDTVTLPHMSILNITAVWRLSLRTLRPVHLLSLQSVKMSQYPSLRWLTRSSVMTSPGLSALNPSPWSRTRSACTAGPKTVDTTAKSVSVLFTTPCTTQMVTVCDPGYNAYGYGHDIHCKEVAQETCYNAPELAEDIQPQTVVFPEPIKTCVQKPIDLVVVTCDDVVAEKCITVPEVEEGEEVHQVCKPELGEPDRNPVVLELPKERCIEIVYGYAHGYGEHHSPY